MRFMSITFWRGLLHTVVRWNLLRDHMRMICFDIKFKVITKCILRSIYDLIFFTYNQFLHNGASSSFSTVICKVFVMLMPFIIYQDPRYYFRWRIVVIIANSTFDELVLLSYYCIKVCLCFFIFMLLFVFSQR